MSDHALALWGLLGTLVFGLASLALGWRSLVRKSLTWGSNTEFISTGTGKGELSISYEGRHFTDVCITRLAVWNHGRGSMSGTEISKSDPLRVELSEKAEILSASVMDQTGGGVSPSLLIDPSDKAKLLLSFDIMNEGDGFSVRVLHHGSTLSPALFGTIRDVPRFQEFSIATDPFSVPRRIVVMAGAMGAMFAAIIVALWTLWRVGPENYLANLYSSLPTLGIVVGVLALTMLIVSSGKVLPNKLLRGFSDSRQ